MKKCPFCAEEIQDEAVKCRFCNEFLQDVKVKKAGGPWYFSWSSIVIGFCVVGPFILPLVWFNPKISSAKKAVATAVIVALSVVLGMAFRASLIQLNQIWELMQGRY